MGSACCALLSTSHHQPCTGSLWPWRYRALSPDASPLQQHGPLSRTHLNGPVLRPRSAACSTGPKLVSPKHTKAEALSWGFSTLKPSIPSRRSRMLQLSFFRPTERSYVEADLTRDVGIHSFQVRLSIVGLVLAFPSPAFCSSVLSLELHICSQVQQRQHQKVSSGTVSPGGRKCSHSFYDDPDKEMIKRIDKLYCILPNNSLLTLLIIIFQKSGTCM